MADPELANNVQDGSEDTPAFAEWLQLSDVEQGEKSTFDRILEAADQN